MISDPYLVVIVICAALFLLGLAAGLPLGYRWGRRRALQDPAGAAQPLAQPAMAYWDDIQAGPLMAIDTRDPVNLLIYETRIFG